MKILLLTHERELIRASNTGIIALTYAPLIVERIVWQRVSPDARLTELIENNQALLLYQKKSTDINGRGSAHSGNVDSTTVQPATTTAESENCNSKLLLAASTGTADNSISTSTAMIEAFANIIIIDSTWQESRKIYNKSPYLKNTPCVSLTTGRTSAYRLRRNQVLGGLCTIECIIEVLTIKGEHELASKLSVEYGRFNQQ